MKKHFRNLVVLTMVMAMLLSVLGVASAAEIPSAEDTATIKVKGIEEGSTVTAYQIVEAVYGDYGVLGYKAVDGASIADVMSPTEDEVTTIAQGILVKQFNSHQPISFDAIELAYDSATQTYFSNEAEAGTYLILVSATTGEWVYNPAVVSNGYLDANDASTLGQQDGNGNVDYNGSNTLESTGTVYAKKSYTSIDKDIVNSSTGNTETEDVAWDDTVTFQITTVVPDYSNAFIEPVNFIVQDVMGMGIAGATNIVVKAGIGDNLVVLDSNAYSQSYIFNQGTGESTLTISFKKAWLQAHPLENIVITYDASTTNMLKNAPVGNLNVASLSFTTAGRSIKILDDTVSLYTFQIDAEKVDADDNSIKLSGAEFELVGEGKTFTATSDANGVLSFVGLDAGEYILSETKAPEGYYLSNKTYTITVEAVYEADNDGLRPNGAVEEIISYTVTAVDNDTDAPVSEVTFTGESTTKDIELDVPNSTLATLPSTGGVGTVALTIGGIVVLALGCVVLFGKKKEA